MWWLMYLLKLLEAINLDFSVIHIYENEFVMKMNDRNKLMRGMLSLLRQTCLSSKTGISPLEDEDHIFWGIFY